MRKIDYAALAEILAQARSSAQARTQGGTPETRLWALGELEVSETIARQFAQRASVDPTAFLRACGLAP